MSQELKALFIGATVWIGSITLVMGLIISIALQSPIDTHVEDKKAPNLESSMEKKSISRKIILSNRQHNDSNQTTKDAPEEQLTIQKKYPTTERNTAEKTNIQTLAKNHATAWVVQLASYHRKNYAQQLVKTLRQKHYKVTLYTQRKNSDTIYAVRLLSPFDNQQQARKEAKKIEKNFNIIPIIIKATSISYGTMEKR